jgi:hypothetical protein
VFCICLIKKITMKNLMMASFYISSVFLIACSGNDSPSSDPSIQPAAQNIVPGAGLTTDSLKSINNNAPVVMNAEPLNPATNKSVTPIPGQKTGSIASGAGLNPAHGQPGHRCDIAVGMPLNSPPVKENAKQSSVQTVAAPVAPAPVNTAPVNTTPVNNAASDGSVKLNPAHGQPGHDCAVQVGAPLKN